MNSRAGRHRLKSVVTILITLLVASCGGDKPEADILRVATMKGAMRAMMLELGALGGAPYRVEWAEFPASQQMIEAIGADAVDIGTVGDAPFHFAYQSGSPIKVVAAKGFAHPVSESLAIIVPPQSPIRSVADLKGKTIATTRGSTGHDLILRTLEQAGLPASSVKISFLSPADARAAFSSGAVEAWSIWMPYLTAALNDKARIIVDSDRFAGGYYLDAASDTAIKNKRPIIADFLKREAAAFLWARSHPIEYAKALQKETGLPLPVAQAIASKGTLAPVPIDDKLLVEQRRTYDRLERAGEISISRPIRDAFDRSLTL